MTWITWPKPGRQPLICSGPWIAAVRHCCERCPGEEAYDHFGQIWLSRFIRLTSPVTSNGGASVRFISGQLEAQGVSVPFNVLALQYRFTLQQEDTGQHWEDSLPECL